MLKIKRMLVLFFSVLLMGTLLVGTVPAKAQTQPPNDGPTPEGLGEDDWAQIEALLPESAPYQQLDYLKAYPQPKAKDAFGSSIAFSGDTLVIGAPDEDVDSAVDAGVVYIFMRYGNNWDVQFRLRASNAEAGDHFGYSVAISGNTLVVGAYGEDSNATGVNGDQSNNLSERSGAAYVFIRKGGLWTQKAYLKASNTGAWDSFGVSVAIAGDFIAVGASGEDSSGQGLNSDQSNDDYMDSGAAYIFARSGTPEVWTQQVYVKSSQSSGNIEWSDYFGRSMAMSGNTLVVGAPEAWVDDGYGGESQCGEAYVFVVTEGVWSEQARLERKKEASICGFRDDFGSSVAISGNTIVIGAPGEDSDARGVNGSPNDQSASGSGAAYVFVRDGTVWQQQAYLKSSNSDAGDSFYQVAIAGDMIVVGAMQEDSNAKGVNGNQDNNSAQAAGAAYVFARSNGKWSQQAYLKASNTNPNDNFGQRLAIFGNTVVVTAPGEDSSVTYIHGGNQADNSATGAGAVYVLEVPPYVVSSLAANDNPTTAATVNFYVTFSEAVTGVDISDFTLDTVMLTGAHTVSVSGGPKTYRVSVNTGSGSGTLHLNVQAHGSIQNADGVPLGGIGGNGDYMTGSTYVVRPSVQTFTSQGAQDGWILESGDDTGVGGKITVSHPTIAVGQDKAHRRYRSILHFNTGALPDTLVITRARLQLKRYSMSPGWRNPFGLQGNLQVDMSNPRFGTGIALQVSDFQAEPSVSSVVAVFNPNPSESIYTAVLDSIGKVNLNLMGSTQFRLRFTGDAYDVESSVQFFSGDAPTVTDRPTLVVEYYIP